MSHIHISKPTAPIQLFEQKNQTTNTRARLERIPEHQKPQSVEFRSIFAPQWGSSEIVVQRMYSGDSTSPKSLVTATVQDLDSETFTLVADEIPTSVPDFSQPEFRNFMTTLKTDRLNVVGEDHAESNQRRKEEKEFCSKYAKSSNYWFESEFPITIDESGKGKKADPDNLKFFHIMQSIKKESDNNSFLARSMNYYLDVMLEQGFKEDRGVFWAMTIYSLDTSSNIISAYLSRTFLDDLTIIKKKIITILKSFMKRMGFGEDPIVEVEGNKNEYNAVVDKTLIKEFEYLYPFFKNMLLAYLHAYETEKKQLNILFAAATYDAESESFYVLPPAREDHLLFQAKEAIEKAESNCQEKLNELITAIKTIKLVDDSSLTSGEQKEISLERSKLIHRTAQKNYKVRGVWKIGDGHVEDIIEILKDSKGSGVRTPLKPDYNLVTKEKFDQALENPAAYEMLWVEPQSEEIAGVHQYARKSGTHS